MGWLGNNGFAIFGDACDMHAFGNARQMAAVFDSAKDCSCSADIVLLAEATL